MTHDSLVDPPPPFGDTVVTPGRAPLRVSRIIWLTPNCQEKIIRKVSSEYEKLFREKFNELTQFDII